MDAHLPLAHLNLTVSDVERSTAFYRRWFDFSGPPTTYPDGTVFVRNRDGFDLALHPGTPDGPAPTTVHFGFRPDEPEAVRGLRTVLEAERVPLIEWHDTPGYVGLKCRDPDGYVIEVYWEPERPTA